MAEGGFAGAGCAGEPRGALSTKDATRSGAGGTAIASYLIAPQTVAFVIEAGFAPLTAAPVYGTAGLL